MGRRDRRVVAQLVEKTKPVTTISPLGGNFGTTAPEITLTCDDGTGSGCAATFYKFGPAGAKKLYVGPFRLYSSMSLCYFSVDSADNVEAEKCQAFSTNTARLATWDPILQVPTCWETGVSCDSNLLSEGRGALFGYPEPVGHAPSTINDSCADGEEGGLYGPELDNVRIYTTDSGPLRSGAMARVDARVWRDGTYVEREFNAFTAEDPTNPTWVAYRNVQQNFGAVNYYNLTTPSRVLSWFGRAFGALRGSWRPGINNSSYPCSTGIYDDFDDLVFAVEQTAGFLPPTVTLTAPSVGATVTGLVPATVTTWDDAGIVGVEYQANGSIIGISKVAPYGITWDTYGFPKGAVTLTATAYDADGNSASNSVAITLN